MEPAPRRRRWVSRNSLQAGQGLVEYALIFVLIVVAGIASLTFFGSAISEYVGDIGTSV